MVPPQLTFNESFNAWLIFWLVYWIVGSVLTYINKNLRAPINLTSVILTLIYNMIWTFLGIVIIYSLPVRILNNWNIFTKLIVNFLILETWFYHIHLFSHQKLVYKKLHKQHHEFTNNSYALVALYCSPYEAVVCNLVAVAIGPVLLYIPAPYLYIYFALVSFNTVYTHSGMTLGWIIGPDHDNHHKYYNYNFGVLGIFDKLYGTNM